MNELKLKYISFLNEHENLVDLEDKWYRLNLFSLFSDCDKETVKAIFPNITAFRFTELIKECKNQIHNGGIPIRSIGLTNLYKFQKYVLLHTTDNCLLCSFSQVWDNILYKHKKFYGHNNLIDIKFNKFTNEINLITISDVISTDFYTYESLRVLFISSLVKYILKNSYEGNL